jgi:hypothetical protein
MFQPVWLVPSLLPHWPAEFATAFFFRRAEPP